MQCPACGNELTAKSVDDVDVDVCDGGCGGIWFENWELGHFDQKQDSAGKELVELDREATEDAEVADDTTCPDCVEASLVQRFYSVNKEVEIDECPACGGVWLDPGELRKIRSTFSTDEERRKAANEFIEKEFGTTFKNMKQKSQENLKDSREFAKMFRWICPSHWLPGEQEWGAF